MAEISEREIERAARAIESECPFTDEYLSMDEIREIARAALSSTDLYRKGAEEMREAAAQVSGHQVVDFWEGWAVEARLDARLAGMDGKLDRLFDRVDVSIGKAEEARVAAIDARTAAASTKWNILFTGIGVAAVMVAVLAFWIQGIEMVGTLLGAVSGN